MVWAESGFNGGVTTVRVDCDGMVYVGTTEGEVHSLLSDGQLQWTFDGHQHGITEIDAWPGRYGAFEGAW